MNVSKCVKHIACTMTLTLSILMLTGCGNSPVDDNNPPDQPEGEFTLFTAATGLADNWVTGILADYTRGGLWFSTIRGISFHNSFNNSWTSFGAESTLPSLEVNSISIDNSSMEIWVATASGTAYLSGASWVEAGADSLLNRYVTKVIGHNGRIWVGTRGGINIRYEGVWSSIVDPLGLLNNGVTDMVVDMNGKIWIGSLGGIAVNNGGVWSYVGATELPGVSVNALFRSHDGKIWVGTAGGVAVFNGLSWQHYTTAQGLPASGVKAFTETREHVIWVGTDAGPAYLSGGGFISFPLPDAAAGEVVTSIAADMMTDDIWFGTMAGAVKYSP